MSEQEKWERIPKHTYEVSTPHGTFKVATKSGHEGARQIAFTVYPTLNDYDRISVKQIG